MRTKSVSLNSYILFLYFVKRFAYSVYYIVILIVVIVAYLVSDK